jgi:hypothetical protein
VEAYAGDMDYCVDSIHDIIKYTDLGKIIDDNKFQLRSVLGSGGFHLLAFGG